MHHFQVTIEFSSGGSMRFRIAILIGILLAFATVSGAAEEPPLLAHSPTVSKTQVVFAYGGYLWGARGDGGARPAASTRRDLGVADVARHAKGRPTTAGHDCDACGVGLGAT